MHLIFCGIKVLGVLDPYATILQKEATILQKEATILQKEAELIKVYDENY